MESSHCWEFGPSGWDPETRSGGSERYEDGSGVNQTQGHICKYVFDAPIMAIFVNSPKVI